MTDTPRTPAGAASCTRCGGLLSMEYVCPRSSDGRCVPPLSPAGAPAGEPTRCQHTQNGTDWPCIEGDLVRAVTCLMHELADSQRRETALREAATAFLASWDGMAPFITRDAPLIATLRAALDSEAPREPTNEGSHG